MNQKYLIGYKKISDIYNSIKALGIKFKELNGKDNIYLTLMIKGLLLGLVDNLDPIEVDTIKIYGTMTQNGDGVIIECSDETINKLIKSKKFKYIENESGESINKNFSKVDIEKCLNAMSDATLNNEAEAIKILKEKFKLSDEDAVKYYHGYCGDKEFSNRINKCFSLIYHVRLTDKNNKDKSVSVDNLEAGSWQEAVDKVISEHPEFGLKPGDRDGSDTVEVHWNYDGETLKSF